MKHLLNSLFGRPTLYPFEVGVIGAIEEHLKPDARALLGKQVKAINTVQRFSNGKEVNLYRMAHGKAEFDDELRFPFASDEELLASATLAVSEDKEGLKVELWLAKGRFFFTCF